MDNDWKSVHSTTSTDKNIELTTVDIGTPRLKKSKPKSLDPIKEKIVVKCSFP